MSTYSKAIILRDEKCTRQMVKYLEEMKYNPLLNLKEMVEEEMEFQSWKEIEP